MAKLLTLKDIDFENKRILLRVDYNVVDDGKITDEFRVRASLPTIKYLLDKNCSIIIISHNGRPDAKFEEKYSLRPVAKLLPRLLNKDVIFMDDCLSDEVKQEAEYLRPGDIMLLENLRFYKDEEKNSKTFSQKLASLADVYIDDAFGAIHRSHASIVGVARLLPSAAGLLVEKEYDSFNELMHNPSRPYTAIIGGAKISDKIEVLLSLLDKVDAILIGGAMANTFLASEGYDMQKSMLEKECLAHAKKIMTVAKKKKVNLILPLDLVVSDNIKSNNSRVVIVNNLKKKDIALDIGPDTTTVFEHIIKISKTVFWNGTLGMAEMPAYAKASESIAHAMISSGAKTYVGGGDTAAFVNNHGLDKYFSFVSTGGGASLEMLSGKKLPGIEVLLN